MKTLIVVSGGDAPGINAFLWHYTRLAAAHGNQVVGAAGGFAGVLDDRIVPLMPELLAPFVALGGSSLASSREPVLRAADAGERLRARLASHAIDNLVLLGGNGSLGNLPPLLKAWDIPCIGIPTTIDNDVPGSEASIGFDSACNYAHAAIDGVLATARALPGRIFIVETLGGDTGFIALAVAGAAGAHVVLVPEIAFKLDQVTGRIRQTLAQDAYALIVISEGIVGARTLAEAITSRIGVRVRETHLGHAQRGAPPTHCDRALAADMAREAYAALSAGTRVGTIVMQGVHLNLYDDVISDLPRRTLDEARYHAINATSSQTSSS